MAEILAKENESIMRIFIVLACLGVLGFVGSACESDHPDHHYRGGAYDRYDRDYGHGHDHDDWGYHHDDDHFYDHR